MHTNRIHYIQVWKSTPYMFPLSGPQTLDDDSKQSSQVQSRKTVVCAESLISPIAGSEPEGNPATLSPWFPGTLTQAAAATN